MFCFVMILRSYLGCVWIDFKLILEIHFWKIRCLVVISNSVKLKNIFSWPNFRAKTQENHFRFYFHFKWLSALENRRERGREKERRDRDRADTAQSSALRWHHQHRADRVKCQSVSIAIAINASCNRANALITIARMRRSRSHERVNRDRANIDRNPAFICPDLMIFFWVLFVFWGMNDIMYSFGNWENVSNK